MPALLVIGSAPCLYEDIDKALSLYPDAELLLLNEASGAVPEAEHILSGHTKKAKLFTDYRYKKFPDCKPFRVHASWSSKAVVPPKEEFPCVTDWWDSAVSSGGTSAGKGALIGLKLGYLPVILCGCPMDGSGYFNPKETGGFAHDCRRIGSEKQQKSRAVQNYKRRMKKLADSVFKGKVFSMSGYTKQVLGAPDEVRE